MCLAALSPIERVLRRIEIQYDGCWVWPGAKTDYGHGKIGFNDGLTPRTHVVTWEFYNGPIPLGLEIDHRCRVPSCCNPDHLEPVGHPENVYRGNAARRSLMCPYGHWVLGDNVLWRTVTKTGRLRRDCLECKRRRARETARRARTREDVKAARARYERKRRLAARSVSS